MRRHPNGTYVYPFPSSATTVNRVDQGQDFGGSGPVVAIGRARILKTHSPWPEYGGTGILYELLDGMYKGKAVYVYEGVKPVRGLRPGQVVQAGQRIGSIVPGTSTGIESGWADPRTGQPISHAEYKKDGTETTAGKQFKEFLEAVKEGPENPSLIGTAIEGPKDLISGAGSAAANAASGVANDVVSGIAGDLASHAEPLMLNVALVGGGAFLVYYGAALMFGVKRPVKGPVDAASKAAAL